MWMATRRTGLNGDKAQMADSAENRKMSFPLLMTINVWKQKERKKRCIILETGLDRKTCFVISIENKIE